MFAVWRRRLPPGSSRASRRRVLPERVNRLTPAGDAEKPQKQAIKRSPAAIRTGSGNMARPCMLRRPPAQARRQPQRRAHRERVAKMRGSRWHAAASIENPKVVAPPRIRESALAPGAERDGGGDAGSAEPMAEQESRGDRDRDALQRRQSGVIVSSRAKNAGDSALTSTCAGRPSASQVRACAVGSGVAGGKGAVLEQHPHDRLAEHDQPSVAGNASPTASSRPRDSACATAARSRRAPRVSFPESAPCPWRRRQCRAAVRAGGWRNRATIPPTARTMR